MIEGDEEEQAVHNKNASGETLLVKEYLLEEARPQTRSLSGKAGTRQGSVISKLPSIEKDFVPTARPVTPQSFRPRSAAAENTPAGT